MNLRGINRIIVAVHDLEKSKRYYSELLGATFNNADWTGEDYGINVAISWDAGIELCAPMKGRENEEHVLNTSSECGFSITLAQITGK